MKNIIIIGVGRRVRDDIIPSLEASGVFNIVGVYARHPRDLQIDEHTYFVNTLSEMKSEHLKKADWIYVGIPPKSTSGVLRFLSGLNVQSTKLIIDTPVLPWRYIWTKFYFRNFAEVIVAEDIIYLPWIEPVKEFFWGRISELRFDHSAYGYHGIALIKALLENNKFVSARLRYINGEKYIHLKTEVGTNIYITEPRDYKNGSMSFSDLENSITDTQADLGLKMTPIISDELCVGLQVGNVRVDFSVSETRLIGKVSHNVTITSLTLELKRVGLVKMWTLLAQDKEAGKSVSDATSDTRLNELVHYFGKWFNVALFI